MTLSPEVQNLAALVDEYGWAKGFVRSKPDDPTSRIEFTFTVALDEKYQLPELMMYGLKEDVINGVIRGVIDHLVEAGGWKGVPLRLTGILNEHPVELRQVHPQHLPNIGVYNMAVRAATGRRPIPGMVQIFWPGRDGKFPWDPDATDAFVDQKRLDIPWP